MHEGLIIISLNHAHVTFTFHNIPRKLFLSDGVSQNISYEINRQEKEFYGDMK